MRDHANRVSIAVSATVDGVISVGAEPIDGAVLFSVDIAREVARQILEAAWVDSEASKR